MNNDSLGDRMKSLYENRTRFQLSGRNYTLIRIDGKAFHTYTKGLVRPFDQQLIFDMDETACFLCKNIQGAKFAFVQSDEISILLTDFDSLTSQAWFDGNVQKMVSISASLATAKFNELRPGKLAMFDSRVFQISDKVEVENYFIWRQQDCTRNSISSVAQSLYSPKQLHGKTTNDMQELIFQKGINWNDYDVKLKRGRMIIKQSFERNGAIRSSWGSIGAEIFTQERWFISKFIPDRHINP
jgi:tRNA(His) 5'-end guanylyltransferase